MFHLLIDPTAAQAAYERLAPRLHAISRDALIPVRGDVQVAAAFALGVARIIGEPRLRARFVKLGETGEFKEACAAELGEVALCAWYARHRFLLAGAARPPAKMPVMLVDEALALRRRLLAVAEGPLRDGWSALMEMEILALEASCEELAGDLLVLSTICARSVEVFPEDDRAFLEREAQRAREVGEEILRRTTGASAEDPDCWGGMVQRAWTLLACTYDEVRRAGRFLFPGRDGERRFPALVVVARERLRPQGLADVYLSEHVH